MRWDSYIDDRYNADAGYSKNPFVFVEERIGENTPFWIFINAPVYWRQEQF